MLKSALILRHLPFEGLGSSGSVLEEGGYQLIHIEAGIDSLPDPLDAGLVVVLGVPTGVIDGEAHRCITVERDCLAPRLAARRPTLRIRPGAQAMAAEAGERPNFERWMIGHKVELAQAGFDPDSLRPDEGTHGASPRCADQSVLHAWLGDLPA